MRLTRQKRALSLLLSLGLALSLTVLPAHAVRFQDVADQQVSVAADALSALGVVGGTGGGKFSPDGHLTRAQLCKMAVEVMGMGEQAEAQAYRTIFTDMGKNHWARGYVNLAAITEVPKDSGTRLMLGLGNGTFGPDREVTYQEAATLALRILGYGAEANRAWPYSAIETATELGLDRDLGIETPSAPITRGQTALLFYHLLSAPCKEDGKPYASKLGNPVENAILLAGDTTLNGQSGRVLVASEEGAVTYVAAGPVDQSLLGKRGWAVLDGEGRFVTLLPDESSSITAAVERREAYYLYLKGHGRYTMSEDTPVYIGSVQHGSVTTYKEYMANLRPGNSVTLYLDEQGKAAGLYQAEASGEDRFVIVGNRKAGYDTFRVLTGAEEDYTIRRNGVVATLYAIEPYDVATYDPVAKVLDVCSVRLSCIYENASPSPSSPNRITAAGGNQFEVMADGIGDFAGRKLNEPITLLFTAGGKVAGLLPNKGPERDPSAVLGVVVEDKEFQALGCNLTLDLSKAEWKGRPNVLDDAVEHAARAEILSAYSNRRDTITLERAGTDTTAQFNTGKMTLDGKRVSASVHIYERSTQGLQARGVSELPASIAAVQYHADEDGVVDLIIVGSYSGKGLDYGRISVVAGYDLIKEGAVWKLKVIQGAVLTRKDGTTESLTGHYDNGFGYLTKTSSGYRATYFEAIKNVPSSAFYIQDGVTYVRTSKGTFPVDEDVACFGTELSGSVAKDPPAWLTWILGQGGASKEEPPGYDGPFYYEAPDVTRFSSLGECRSFADTVTVYVDRDGQRVRCVEAGN